MLGKIRKNLQCSVQVRPSAPEPIVCPICGRTIPDSQKDAHHLVPKSKGGRSTEYLHRICHRQIHALFSETELARVLNTAEALREQPEMKKFIAWVSSKPEAFYERTSKSQRRKLEQGRD